MELEAGDRHRVRWNREELLAVLYLMLWKGEALRSPQNHPATAELAGAMGRTVDSITMRVANYRSLDPAYSGRGLDGGGRGPFVEIWHEYVCDPRQVMAEARRAYHDFVNKKKGI